MSPAIEELKEAIIHACGGMTREEVKYVVNKYLEKELHKLRKERDFWMRKATIPRETMDSTVQTTETSEKDLKVLRKLAVIGKYDFLMNEGPKFKNVDEDKANSSGEILFEIPVNIPTGVINVPAEGSTPVPFTFTVPQNVTVLEAITASQGTTVKDYIGVTAGKTYTWSVVLTYTPPQPVVRGLWQLKNGSDSVLVQIVKYIGSNLVGSGASVLSYSEAINKISPTITAY